MLDIVYRNESMNSLTLGTHVKITKMLQRNRHEGWEKVVGLCKLQNFPIHICTV
jgi:hypothetical protein